PSDVVLLDKLTPEITQLTLNRPDKLNAMNDALVDRLYERCDEIEDDPECRVVILTGQGRGFCAGLDLTGFGAAPRQKGWGGPGAGLAVQQHIAGLIPRLRALRQPVIAAVNGPCAGGGLALALASDVRVCSESARFNVAFVRIGLSGCDVGVSWLLPRLIGASRATEMMLTGRLITAAEADKYGLVSEVVPDGETVNAALNVATQIVANSPFGVWMTKEASWASREIPSLQAAIDLENRTQILSSFSEDQREAITAFLQKRPPTYQRR
ncbi:MAG TPA: enoyl-CoA hydratase/isomerase family protein, partial [Acidimicrobiales bacterium]|nr:enoyl-CoA hydratase/isomerase family protein [Acidimicrobiales bacterium]